jgi:hypothetical protein
MQISEGVCLASRAELTSEFDVAGKQQLVLVNPQNVVRRNLLIPLILLRVSYLYFLSFIDSPIGPRPPNGRGCVITLRHTATGGIPLDEWSDRRKDFYLTKHNTHKRQTSMPVAGFETAIPASERPQTYRSRGHWVRPHIHIVYEVFRNKAVETEKLQ